MLNNKNFNLYKTTKHTIHSIPDSQTVGNSTPRIRPVCTEHRAAYNLHALTPPGPRMYRTLCFYCTAWPSTFTCNTTRCTDAFTSTLNSNMSAYNNYNSLYSVEDPESVDRLLTPPTTRETKTDLYKTLKNTYKKNTQWNWFVCQVYLLAELSQKNNV